MTENSSDDLLLLDNNGTVLMISVFHINVEAHADLTRDIRSPMTKEMSQLMRTLTHVGWNDSNEDQRALSDKFDEMKNTERLRLIRVLYRLNGYQKVARVNTDKINDAYQLTQNGVVVESWSSHPSPKVYRIEPSYHLHNMIRYGRRSTSVGDLLQSENGDWFVVDRFGFIPIEFG